MIESLKQLQEKALTYPEMASDIIIHNAETLKGANKFLLAIKGMIKEITDAFKPMKQKTNEAHKVVVAQEREYLDPLFKAEKSAKLQIGIYVRKVEDERREAERKAYIAEQEQLREAAKIEAEAQKFENHGHHKEAEEIRETISAPVTKTLPDAPSLNGISVRKILTFEITDESMVPDRFKSIDTTKIRAYLREHKEKAIEHDIPGIRIFYEDSVAARSGD